MIRSSEEYWWVDKYGNRSSYKELINAICSQKPIVKEVTRDYNGSMTVTLEGNSYDFVDGFPGLFKGHSKNELYRSNKEEIKRVIFNEPYTIVIWANGEKTIVKAQDGEPYDKEKGLAMCFAKYALGNTCRYFDFFKEVCDE